MSRLDLLDEYTCMLVPRRAHHEANKPAALQELGANNRRTSRSWGPWMAAAGGFAAFVIAAMELGQPG